MADKSGIEWTDATWNPVTGCDKVSQGCKHCYAERVWQRLSKNPDTVYYQRPFTNVAAHPERFELPMRWLQPRRIFVDSMGDLFHDQVSDATLLHLLAVMGATPHHRYQVLTKRPLRMQAFMSRENAAVDVFWEMGKITARYPDLFDPEVCKWPLPNVQLGVSAEDQLTWDERVPLLLETPAALRFVSAEPLLGLIDGRSRTEAGRTVSVPPIAEWPLAKLDMVIVGGESGPKARPTHVKWARWLRDQCVTAGVPFFFKQWGEWCPISQLPDDVVVKPGANIATLDGCQLIRAGKKLAGRQLDGVVYDEQPGDSQTEALRLSEDQA